MPARPLLRRSVTAAALAAVALPVVHLAPAAAAPPTVEVEQQTVQSPFLTELCGVPVFRTDDLTFRVRTWDPGTGVLEVVTVNGTRTYFLTEGGTTEVRRNVGTDVLRATPDGRTLLLSTGQNAGLQGSELIDADTGEVLREDQLLLTDDAASICDALLG